MSKKEKLAERIATEMSKKGVNPGGNIKVQHRQSIELPQESQTGKSTPKS